MLELDVSARISVIIIMYAGDTVSFVMYAQCDCGFEIHIFNEEHAFVAGWLL